MGSYLKRNTLAKDSAEVPEVQCSRSCISPSPTSLPRWKLPLGQPVHTVLPTKRDDRLLAVMRGLKS